MVWSPIIAVESIGVQNVQNDLNGPNGLNDLNQGRVHRRSIPVMREQHRQDRVQEHCQHLERKIRDQKLVIRQLKSENEGLRRQIDVLEREANEFNTTLFTFAPVASEAKDSSVRNAGFMVAKYNGMDPVNFSKTWLKTIINVSKLYCWNDRQKLLVAKMALSGEARHWITFHRPDICTFAEFKQAFEFKYNKKHTTVAKVHMDLASRKRISGEPVRDFVKDIYEMAQLIQLSKSGILHYIILGLADEDEYPKSMLEKYTKLDDLINYLRDQDTIRLPKYPHKNCYNCGRTGHIMADCKVRFKDSLLVVFLIALLLHFMFS